MRVVAAVLLMVFASGSPAWGQAMDDAKRCAEISDPDQGLPYCNAAIDSGKLPPSPLAVTFDNRGLDYYKKGNYERAIQDFDRAILLNPRDVRAYGNRGNAYQKKGDYDRAIQDYDQAIRFNPSLALAFRNRGFAYSQKGDYDRAIQDYDQAIRLNPSYADAFKNRGWVRFDQGQFAAAQPDFARALELEPGDPYLALWLFLARSRAGQDARSELEKSAAHLSLTAWPGPVINLYLGKATPEAVLSAADDYDAKKNRGQHCEAYFYLGEHALIAGNRPEAKRLFQQVIDTRLTSFDEYTGAQAELKRLSP